MNDRTQPRPAPDERGMILINVLIIVMLATAILAVILASEQDDVERTTALRGAAQAQATARGAELSAITALRRDLARGGESDGPRDEWATIGDRDVAIPGGRFSFAVGDAQARFNVNNLTRGDAYSRAVFLEIAAAVGLPPELAERIVVLLAQGGAIDDLTGLRVAGIEDADLRRLAVLCTALPRPTDVNLNSAPEALLALLLGNPAIAHTLVTLRTNGSGLTPSALQSAGTLLPPGAAIKSDFFWAHARVTIGQTDQQLTSLLYRHMASGRPAVVAVRRWRGTAPLEAPPLQSPSGP